LDLPLGRFIVVTGPSGSGKSSLAFDTIYAEGQRRYVETFSPYTRQFLERMDKPLADSIEGIPPAIAIEQANNIRTTRSTVGTITEINDYLKLLFPRLARGTCPSCGKDTVEGTPASIIRSALDSLPGRQVLVAFAIPFPADAKPADFFQFLAGQGYLRAWAGGKVVRTDSPPKLRRLPKDTVVIQDRLVIGPDTTARLNEALENALRLGSGRVQLVDMESGGISKFSSGPHCPSCDLQFTPPSPGLFSFNSPLGACPHCKGFGRVIGIDMDRVMPDPSLSIAEGVIKAFQSGQARECQEDLERHCRKRHINTHLPFSKLPKAARRWVLEGDPDVDHREAWESGGWYGVQGYFKWLESKAYKMHIRVLLSRYRSYQPCPECAGGRYRPETLLHKLGPRKLTIADIAALPMAELQEVLSELTVPPADKSTALVLAQITSRVGYLLRTGLGYLTLHRPTRSLSGGEIQRVNLTTCLGASLVNTLFVLDEPTVGLHPRDTLRLVSILESLRDKGNTLLVVEHEEAVIRAADHLVDIGPGRGAQGGSVLHSGPVSSLDEATESLTRDYLLGIKAIPVPSKRRKPQGAISLRGINHHNLSNLDVDIPLGVLCAVTGVSGSGKTSLVRDILHRHLGGTEPAQDEAAGSIKSISGDDDIEEVVMVDQSPLARSPRSTPALYLGVHDHIRGIFAASKDAEEAGFTASTFSFNSGDGRCERCGGLGFEKVEMQFLSDLFLRCPECEGTRFRAPVLRIKVGGRSIHEVLEMSAKEAIAFLEPFDPSGKATAPLRLLAEVGLEYLRLGQPVNALSGGEAQRLKLVHHLARRDAGRALLIFDEPTTGLHFDDVAQLVRVFHRLVEEGNSIVVIEHNLEVVKCSDHVVDMGPEGGPGGGRIVAEGTPEMVASNAESETGRHLAPLLGLAPANHMRETTPPQTTPRKEGAITVRGAREHNLKNISFDIPRDGMVVVTGLSGSGKSTLAFDLLFAEGQRRFLDSMSAYARQFVDQMEKPDVDSIEGLPPGVAIEQRITRGGGKSTVATVTEIQHFLRLLFAKLGTRFCPDCHVPVEARTPTSIAEELHALASKHRVRIFANLVKGRKGYHTDVARAAGRQGIETLVVDGSTVRVTDFTRLERYKEHTIDALVAVLDHPDWRETEEAVRKALRLGKGTARIEASEAGSRTLSSAMNCPGCGTAFEPLEPRLFSFNSPHGWCTHCRGFGEVWSTLPAQRDFESVLQAELEEERRHESLDEGEPRECPICKGLRLNQEALHVRIGETSIADFLGVPASDAATLCESLTFQGAASEVARDILAEIRQRLDFLSRVGLDYLSLNRAATTLSGGESQRIRLAAQLGSNLRGVLYVLDEPTIGLHPRDNEKLLEAMELLAGKGNSLVVVEHDQETMRRADHILDLGPGAGSRGGEVVASGRLEDILAHPTSLTGRHLREPMPHPSRGSRRPEADSWLTIKGATRHNIRGIDVRIPLERLTVVTGVSGSGKSTLLRGVVVPVVKDAVARRKAPAWSELCQSIEGFEPIGAVLEVDQSPIGKTSRSTPATYVKVFDAIRAHFASLPSARMRGYTASRFSFNNEEGRCPACLGQGVVRLEMNFLPTGHMPCEDWGGRSYDTATLEILLDGKSIGDVMEMTIDQAADFFSAHPKIMRPLALLRDTGLGYLKLGQPSPTLSGGEAQRIKLVTRLARRATAEGERVRTTRKGKSTLYILEEPTIGLHAHDVSRLIDVVHRLVDEGGTVVVIEHHMDLAAEADHVIDIGPEAGAGGGHIVASGTPETVARSRKSRTAPFLREALNPAPARR
jgi:excinuclease ABC subunit A